MRKDKKGLSGKEKRRLKFIWEAREQRNITKHNIDFIFPKKRDIRFKDQESKK